MTATDLDLKRDSAHLLQFAEASGSDQITDDDLVVAHKIVTAVPGPQPSATTIYPVDWNSKRTLKAFLRNWRHRTAIFDRLQDKASQISLPPSPPPAPTKTASTPFSPEDITRLTTGLEKLDLHKSDRIGLFGKPRIGPLNFGSKGHSRTRSESIFDWEPPSDIEEPRQEPRQSRSKDKMPESSNPAGTAPQVLTAEAAVAMMNAAMQNQRNAINQDFTTMMAEAFRQNQAQNPPSTPNSHHGGNGNGNGQNQSLKSTDVGIFNPEFKDPHQLGMVSDGKMTVYTDIYAFTDRIKDLAATRSDAQVREIWTQCLQGSALVWYSQVLTEVDRELLRSAPVSTISAKLLERFKPHYGDAMSRWKSSSYGLTDVGTKDIMVYS